MKATEMEGRNPDGTFAVGNKPKNGLDKNPQNRHSGAWHKEDTPRYKMERIMSMGDTELEKVIQSPEYTSFERGFANIIILSRTAEDIQDAEAVMRMYERMINQVYGPMPQVNINAEADEEASEEASKFIRGFALP